MYFVTLGNSDDILGGSAASPPETIWILGLWNDISCILRAPYRQNLKDLNHIFYSASINLKIHFVQMKTFVKY